MQCQYSDCTNIGVHSCNDCGRLVCGKHVGSFSGPWVRCETCARPIREANAQAERVQQQMLQERLQEQIRKKEKAENSGRSTIWFGLGIIVFGIILCPIIGQAEGGNGPYGLIVVLILIIGIATIIAGVNRHEEPTD